MGVRNQINNSHREMFLLCYVCRTGQSIKLSEHSSPSPPSLLPLLLTPHEQSPDSPIFPCQSQDLPSPDTASPNTRPGQLQCSKWCSQGMDSLSYSVEYKVQRNQRINSKEDL